MRPDLHFSSEKESLPLSIRRKFRMNKYVVNIIPWPEK